MLLVLFGGELVDFDWLYDSLFDFLLYLLNDCLLFEFVLFLGNISADSISSDGGPLGSPTKKPTVRIFYSKEVSVPFFRLAHWGSVESIIGTEVKLILYYSYSWLYDTLSLRLILPAYRANGAEFIVVWTGV